MAAVGAVLSVRQLRSSVMRALHGPPGAKHAAICGASVGAVSCADARAARVKATTTRDDLIFDAQIISNFPMHLYLVGITLLYTWKKSTGRCRFQKFQALCYRSWRSASPIADKDPD